MILYPLVSTHQVNRLVMQQLKVLQHTGKFEECVKVHWQAVQCKGSLPLYSANCTPVVLSRSLALLSRQAARIQRLSCDRAMLVTDWPMSSAKRHPALTSNLRRVPSTLPAIISSLHSSCDLMTIYPAIVFKRA